MNKVISNKLIKHFLASSTQPHKVIVMLVDFSQKKKIFELNELPHRDQAYFVQPDSSPYVYRGCMDYQYEQTCSVYNGYGTCYCTDDLCNGQCTNSDCVTKLAPNTPQCYVCDSISDPDCTNMSSSSFFNQTCLGPSCYTSYYRQYDGETFILPLRATVTLRVPNIGWKLTKPIE